MMDTAEAYDRLADDYDKLVEQNAKEKQAVISFLAGYSMSDHLGDVSDDIVPLLKAFGIELGDWGEQSDVLDALVDQGLFDADKWKVL